MRLFYNWISCAANIAYLLFLLCEGPHGECRANHLQAQIQPQTRVWTARSFSEAIVKKRKDQQRAIWQRLANQPIDYRLLSIVIQQKEIRNEDDEKLLTNPRLITVRDPLVAIPNQALITRSSWSGIIQPSERDSEPSQDLRLVDSRVPMATLDTPEYFPSNAADEFMSNMLMLYVQIEVIAGSSCEGAISEAEYDALQDLYLATGGANWHWHNTTSGESQWVFPSNLTAPCSDRWEGIYCAPYTDPLEPRVSCAITGLVLPLTGLRGQLPASISNLQQLEILSLQSNNLGGSIPTSLGDLVALTALALYQNSLTGPIPHSLGNMTALTDLSLYENSLMGTIPTTLGALTALTRLILYQNSLNGFIPSSLGDLTALTQLFLNQNSLTGPIPPSLGKFTALTVLYLYDNSLTGPIASSLGNLTALTLLGLNGNSLTGPIPDSLGNLRRLTLLNLQINLLTGLIPTSLRILTAVKILYLNENSLTGSIPTCLGSLTTLTLLNLYKNSLTGPIPSSLGNLTALTLLGLDENSLQGPIPSLLGDLTALTLLRLNTNSLTGPIPTSLGGLTALTILDLHDNRLDGSVLASLGNATALTELYLNQNLLTGPIPSSLGELTALTQLYLSENSFEGSIPSSLGDLTAIAILYLNDNSLTGPIPSSLGELTALTQLYLNENRLMGNIPSTLGSLILLHQLSASNNALVGTLPGSLGLLEKCYYVNMSTNSLTGPIPVELSSLGSNLPVNLTKIGAGVALDLSQNAFTGTISPLLFSRQMKTMLLYSNCMSGSLPNEICSSSSLQTLVLDKLTSGSTCQISVPGFKAAFAATTVQGSIPECVWAMPKLHTLHLSGNGLQGSLGVTDSVNTSLVNVDVSNNFLTGSIPTSLQTQPQHTLQQLALNNNKLAGSLSPSFAVGNLTLLTLAVNRLSGHIPASFANTPGVQNFFVLTGNLFACGGSLPAADPASSSYVCGSEALNAGLYICAAFVGYLFFVVVIFLCLHRSSRFTCACVVQPVNEGLRFLKHYSEASLKLASLHRFVDFMKLLRVQLSVLGICYTAVFMPAYVILKTATTASILTEEYGWIVTSAFLHGYESMGCLAFFVLFSVVFLALIVKRLDSLLNHSLRASAGMKLSLRGTHLKWSYVFQRLLLQTGSLVIVLMVNVLFVYGVVFGGLSPSEQLLVLSALGLFKVLWQGLFVKYAVSWIAKCHDDTSVGGLIFHQVSMTVLSFIVAPFLATLGADSNCLYFALQGPYPISSTFNITLIESSCGSLTFGNGKTLPICMDTPYNQSTTISITPPWFYSYHCTSALLTNYIPVLLVMFAINAIVLPLISCCLLLLPDDFRHRIWQPKYFEKNKIPAILRLIATNVLIDLTILITFGLTSPLLGMMIVLKQFAAAVPIRLSIGRYLQKAEDIASVFAELEDAVQQFRGGDTRVLLGFLLCVVGVFWGAMLFDMVADLHGNTAGGVAWAVAFVLWTAATAIAYTFAGEITECVLSACLIFSVRQHMPDESADDSVASTPGGDLVPPLAANSYLFDRRENSMVLGNVHRQMLNPLFHRESVSESLVVGLTKNAFFTDEVAAGADAGAAGGSVEGDGVGIHGRNSSFGLQRDSDLEII